MSKAHGGSSLAYNKKKVARESRNLERECLKEAKELFFKTTGLDLAVNRGKVTSLKRKILAERVKTLI